MNLINQITRQFKHLPKIPRLSSFSRRKKISLLSLAISIVIVFVGVAAYSGKTITEQLSLTPPPKPENQIQDVLKLTANLQKLNLEASQSGQVSAQQLQQMTKIASDRKEKLLEQIENNPQGFLDTANLADQRQNFPQEVQNLIEQRVNVTGSFTDVHFDNFQDKKTQNEYFVKSEVQRYQLHFAQQKANLLSGSKVQVLALGLDNQLVLGKSNSTNAVYNLNVLDTSTTHMQSTGEKKIAAILVRFTGDSSQYISLDGFKNMFSKTGYINNYYAETSGNKITFTPTFYEITIDMEYCGYYLWADKVLAKLDQQGVDVSSFNILSYTIPGAANNGCYSYWAGLGTVGGNPTENWIFYLNNNVYVHEIGHNLGLHHANSLKCEGKAIDVYSSCVNTEYGDDYDVMGYSYFGNQLNAPHKISLGWLPQSNVQTVTTSGTYTIYPTEVATNQPQVLRILKPNTDEYYYVSYRKKVGFDNSLPAVAVRGASIHLWNEVGYTQTRMLDLTPNKIFSGYLSEPTLSDNAVFYDQLNEITIKQLSHTDDSVTIQVIKGPAIASTLKNWQPITPLPKTLYGMTSVSNDEYIYLIGGQESSSFDTLDTIYYAKINDNGTIGSWTPTTPLPFPMYGHPALIEGNRMYLLGYGYDSNYSIQTGIYSTQINPDGGLGTWSKISGLPYDSQMVEVNSFVELNGYIYVFGFFDKDWYVSRDTFYAKLNEDGSIGSWQKTSEFPFSLTSRSQIVASRNQIYRYGLIYSAFNVHRFAYVATVREDGSLSNWVEAKPDLPWPQQYLDGMVVGANGYLFSLGGIDIDGYSARNVFVSKTSQDGVLTTWLTNEPMPMRLSGSATAVGKGYLFVLGGLGGNYGGDFGDYWATYEGTAFKVNTYQNSAFSVKLPPSILAQEPFGLFERISPNNEVIGWAYDPDQPNQEVDVEFYIDEPYVKQATASAVFKGRTSIFRGDVNSGRHFTGNHGFQIKIPEQYLDGKDYKIYAYGIDLETGNRKQLVGTPKSILEINQSPVGNFENITSDGYLVGWAYDPDEASKSATVEFYVDFPYEQATTSAALAATVTTDILRDDINRTKNITGNHGFKIPLPAKYKDGIYRLFFGYAVDTKTGTKQPLSNSRKYYPAASGSPAPVSSGMGSATNASGAANLDTVESSNSASSSGVLGTQGENIGIFSWIKEFIKRIIQ